MVSYCCDNVSNIQRLNPTKISQMLQNYPRLAYYCTSSQGQIFSNIFKEETLKIGQKCHIFWFTCMLLGFVWKIALKYSKCYQLINA